MVPLYMVAALAFTGVVVIFCIYYSNGMKMTSYTAGTVLRSEDRVVRDEHERREETVLAITYSVRGKEYQIEHLLRGNLAKQYPAGRRITVWYNPTVPEMAKIKPTH